GVGEQGVERGGPAWGGSQAHAEGRRDTDGWRTSHDQGANGLGDVLPAHVLARQLLARQSSLVEQQQAVARPADRRDHGGLDAVARPGGAEWDEWPERPAQPP